jgi:hypothetical protein
LDDPACIFFQFGIVVGLPFGFHQMSVTHNDAQGITNIVSGRIESFFSHFCQKFILFKLVGVPRLELANISDEFFVWRHPVPLPVFRCAVFVVLVGIPGNPLGERSH